MPTSRPVPHLRYLIALGCLVNTACRTPDPGPCSTAVASSTTQLTMHHPHPDRDVTLPWTPIVVEVPDRDWSPDHVVVCLDGQPVTTPPPSLGLVGLKGTSPAIRTSLWVDTLPPGEHTLEVIVRRASAAVAKATSRFEVVRAPHRVRVAVFDEAGPLDARVLVEDEHGTPVLLGTNHLNDSKSRDATFHHTYAMGGVAHLDLQPGTYRVHAVRDFLHDIASATLTVPGTAELELPLPRVLQHPEHVAADLHVHTHQSPDAVVPDLLRYQSVLAGGLDVVIVTDHNKITDPRPMLDYLQDISAHQVLGLPGIESDMRQGKDEKGRKWDLGHFNAFPLKQVPDEPIPATTYRRPRRYIQAYRDRQQQHPFFGGSERLLLQLNHPRGIHFDPKRAPGRSAWPLFQTMALEPDRPLAAQEKLGQDDGRFQLEDLRWDAIELVNRFSFPLYLDVRDDWFSLLNQGLVMTATGNSDSHAAQVELAGMTVNWVHVPPRTEGEDLDPEDFIAAIQDGHLTVSTGPIVNLRVRHGEEAASPGHTLSPSPSDAPWIAEVHVMAPPWVPVPEVRWVVNGAVMHTVVPDRPEGTTLDHTWRWTIPANSDLWVSAEAGWPVTDDREHQPEVGGRYGKVAPGYVPLGFTNPVFVDIDGAGWQAPGLPGHKP